MGMGYRVWTYLFYLSCFSALAQQNGDAGKGAASAPAGTANHSIALDVVVTDKSGQVIPGLQQQDFTLLDDKQPQKITSFHAVEGVNTTDDPAEVIFVVDEVNAGFQNVAFEQQEMEKFLGRNGGKLARPASIVFFTDSGATRSKPTQDGNVLIAILNQNKGALRSLTRSQGFYGGVEQFQLSLRILGQLADSEATRPGRKLIVWISPGWPLLSGRGVELSSKNQQGFFASIVALSDELREARIVLYNVDPAGSAIRSHLYKDFYKGTGSAKQVQIGNLGLQVLAYQSGGLVLDSTSDIAGEIATCVADANASYVVSFDEAVADGPNDYHGLAIKIDKPGLAARTRAGYYAQPERTGTP